ncbi:O-antigen ligase family protein [Anaerocolumna chitinilytica]|uniref:Polymerase n=1 Tax=Anaerocolumna chitinilytica TaxID=1727145 RepID=A0A7I8DIM9_9FIRM|nr:O-antigen ligase family protein [Anaerocolumna chitinilytica]BCJ97567.1 polymerase [Anaerocolumna chitinilytica]
MAAAASIFLPYMISGIILVSIAIYIAINKQTREVCLEHKEFRAVLGFQLFFQVISLIYGNWMGVLGGFAFTLAAILGIFQYHVMTAKLYEKCLNIMCVFSCFSTVYALVEQVLINNHELHYERVCSLFFYPNYFATISATIVLICAYKLLTKQGNPYIFYIAIVMNLINIYLSQSMFGWVEVLAGVSVMLLVLRYYRLLASFVGVAVLGIAAILFVNPDIIPRVSQANLTLSMRFQIWQNAIAYIKEAPLFGKGVLTYAYSTLQTGKIVAHSHSIVLESLLNYGFLGSAVLAAAVGKYLMSILKRCYYQRNTKITSLILGVMGAALVHGLTDITLMWLQTLPLFIFLLAGAGAFKAETAAVKKIAAVADSSLYERIPGYMVQKVTPVIVYCKKSCDNSKELLISKENVKERASA